MEKILKIFLTTLILLGTILSAVQIVLAEDVSVNLTVDRNVVVVGGYVRLTLSVNGVQSAATPVLPELDGFEVISSSSGTSVSIVNGRMSSSVNFQYVLRALQEGTYEIGPFSLKIGQKTYETNKVNVEVTKSSTGSVDSGRGTSDIDEDIFLTLEISRDEVYIGERIPARIRLYVGDIRTNTVSYPTLTANGFSIQGFNEAIRGQEHVNGKVYDVLEFGGYVTPVSSGKLSLGPARISAEVLVRERRQSVFGDPFFDEFFSSYTTQTISIVSNSPDVTVFPLPEQGKPRDFAGAIGRFTLSVEAVPTSVKVGDPIVLSIRITGTGDLKRVAPPSIDETSSFKVYDAQVKDTGETSGTKVFEQVLIPLNDGIIEIPRIVFSYFDPSVGEYKTVTEGPIPIEVHPDPTTQRSALIEAMDESDESVEPVLGEDILYIKNSPGRFGTKRAFIYTSPWFWGLNAIPLVGLVTVSVYSKRKNRLESDLAYARALNAAKQASRGIRNARKALMQDDSEFCDLVYKVIQQYVGDKFNLPVQSVGREVVATLRADGLSSKCCELIQKFFEECDKLRFAPLDISHRQKTDLLDLAETLIKEIECSGSRGDE